MGHVASKQVELRKCDHHFPFLILYFSFLIFHFSFYIFHFSFFISLFRFLRVSAFRQTPPSTRLGNRGQSCLSTDCRAPTSRTSSHYTAYTRCRFVKLSDHICPLSFFIFHLSLKALVTPTPAQQGLFPYPRRATEKGDRKAVSGIIAS